MLIAWDMDDINIPGVVEYSFVLKITSIAGCYGLMRFLRW